MPRPTRAKPPVPAWIIRERKRLGLKPRDLAERLTAMGLAVTEGTVRTWEAGRSPHPDNIEGLERIFGSAAPGSEAATADTYALISAMTQALMAQTQALTDVRLELVAIRETMTSAREGAIGEREAHTDMLSDLGARLNALLVHAGISIEGADQGSGHR